MRRRTAYAVVVAVLMLATTACDDSSTRDDAQDQVEPHLNARQAQKVYLRTLNEIARASLAGNPASASPSVSPEVVYLDGESKQCTYTARLELDGVVFGDNVPWDEVRTATEDAQADHGFRLTGQLDIPGGYNGFDATTDRGARLEVRSKTGQPSTLTISAPVTGPCSSEVNETLKPLGR